MNTAAITIDGRYDAGAWHRAIMVGRELYRAGLWDGAQPLTIVDAYAVHGRLFGCEQAAPSALMAGSDYKIGGAL